MLVMKKNSENSPRLSESRNGFTIVELLIVVVIIAILATITIVSFRGVQDRASVAATSTNIRTYVNGLEMMKTVSGGYFRGDGALGVTGESTGSIIAVGDRCTEYGVTPGRTDTPAGSLSSNFNQAMLPYLGSIPKQAMTAKVTFPLSSADGCTVSIESSAPYYFGVKKILIKDNTVTYTLFAPADTSPTASAFDISYSLRGDANCFVGDHLKIYRAEYGYTECHTFGGDVTRE